MGSTTRFVFVLTTAFAPYYYGYWPAFGFTYYRGYGYRGGWYRGFYR